MLQIGAMTHQPGVYVPLRALFLVHIILCMFPQPMKMREVYKTVILAKIHVLFYDFLSYSVIVTF